MSAVARSLSLECEDLLSTLVSDHSHALLAYTEAMLRDRSLAQDVVQETMIRAWRHCQRLQPQHGSLRAWLLTVARNIAIDHLRSAWSRHERVDAQLAGADRAEGDPADVVVAATESERLLENLSPEHREVLRLTLLDDLSLDQAAALLEVPVGTIKSRRHYALRQLRLREAETS